MKIVLGATVTAVNKNRNNVTKKHHGMMTLFIPKKCCTRLVHRDTAVKTINKSNIYIYKILFARTTQGSVLAVGAPRPGAGTNEQREDASGYAALRRH